MAKLDRIKPGQTLYDVKRNSGIEAFRGKYSVWQVQVLEVNLEDRFIIASWNTNPPRKMSEQSVSKLRTKHPK